MLASGVYTIRNTLNGREYVGSAAAFRYRWNKHRSELSRGVHSNSKLQRAWDKHGPAAFEFKPLLICARKDNIFYEQRAMDALQPFYNLVKKAGSVLGLKRGPFTAEHRAKLKASHVGRTYKKRTLEQRAKMAAAMQKRYADAPAPTGMVLTAERRAKISAALTGIVRSPATCARISAAKKGTVPTDEARRNMSAAATAAWARRKAKNREAAS